jgi:hypothetical protein
MSVFKQLEALTPEEILELTSFLEASLKKLEKRIKMEVQNKRLNSNLDEVFSGDDGIKAPIQAPSKLEDYQLQFKLLTSSKNKIWQLAEVVKERE